MAGCLGLAVASAFSVSGCDRSTTGRAGSGISGILGAWALPQKVL